MWEAFWEFLATDRARNLFALIAALGGLVALGRWLVALWRRKRTKLKEDAELLSSLKGADVEPPEVFIGGVQKRAKEVLDPHPWLWSFSHLWTLLLIWFLWWVVSNGTFLGPWYRVLAQAVNTTWLLMLIFVFANDIVWCRSHWYRGTRLGIWANRRTKLPGDFPSGLSKRRNDVLLRDYRLGRIHPAYLPDEEED